MDSPTPADKCWCEDPVMVRLGELYRDLIAHDGFGELRVDVRILKRKQKEVIITCGKQYRYVLDAPGPWTDPETEDVAELDRAPSGAQKGGASQVSL